MRRALVAFVLAFAVVVSAGGLGATGVVSGDAPARERSGGPDESPGPRVAIMDVVSGSGDWNGTGNESGEAADERAGAFSSRDAGRFRDGGATGARGVANGTDTDGDGLSDARENATGIDPFAADSDADGLLDGREREVGTDPLAADTDRDGVPDGSEVERGTSPRAADGDGDGVDGARELGLGTDPFDADTDGDGVPDGEERELGTDPTGPDTDGDGLDDGWEVRDAAPSGASLPESDPLQKDLYVQVDYARGVRTSDRSFYDSLEGEFAEMPVENPGGGTGIDLHVSDGGRINESVRFTGDNFWSLKDSYYESRLGARAGVYHHVVVAEFAASEVGYGEVGGEFSLVAGDADAPTRRFVVVHELLHNVVGPVRVQGACEGDPKHYCDGGYLTPHVTPGEGEYLPEPLAAQLEARGFVEG